jgi:signal transduction histidine kinase
MGQEVHRVEAILRGSQRMNRMIQDLLDTARLESGHLELALAPLDLGAFVTHTLEQALPPEERSRVRVELPSYPLYVSADRDRFDRVLLNLVSNALKYSPSDRPVLVRVSRVDHEARLEVVDRGTGIRPEDQAHLFEKYFRVRGARAPGTGLGLYTARLLVEAHGGHVAAASTWGEGSTFAVTVPLAPQTLVPVPEAGAVRAHGVPPRTAS